MFRNLRESYTERVDIIGNKAFMEFVEDLEKLEDLKFDTFQIGKDKLQILTVQPMEEKKDLILEFLIFLRYSAGRSH